MARAQDAPSYVPWVHPNFYSCTPSETVVPFTFDYLLQTLGTFAARGEAEHGKKRCLKVLGDATHDVSEEDEASCHRRVRRPLR